MSKELKAWKTLLEAIEKRGSNCNYKDAWKDFCGDVLPDAQTAQKMCRGCPVAGADKECRAYVDIKKGNVYGVYDGQVFDAWGDLEREDTDVHD